MATEYGPVGKDVDTSNHKLTNVRVSSVVPPMKDLKNQPNGDAERAIRSLRYTPNAWKANIQSAMRQRVK